MVIGDEVEAFVIVLQFDVLLDRAEVIAEVQLAGGLDAAEHSLFRRFRHDHSPLRFGHSAFPNTVPSD